ncbi:hypothetical protein M514_03725 [Trichuris suis]|uniref:DRBM domain-containing protein n=1 Tax=Trichuris suis TaxID=68888 RepID=A0A085MDT9_9BILA|nr:hypothetical protein M513_03725 [Trichuris suis]KFD68708.1 hypothetical protein M514_03725 [Trichuris suis]KHJ42623.1 hypothetical protein D918_07342 [Trichuris suis]
MSDKEKSKTPADHVNVFARRNGFACLFDVKFDHELMRFSASLKVGSRVFTGCAKTKKAAKHMAAISFLRFLCSSGIQAHWGLPEDNGECEAHLNRMLEALDPHCHDKDGAGSRSSGGSRRDETPRMGHFMELKRTCHMRRVTCEIVCSEESNGKFRATVKLGTGQEFEATGDSGRKAKAAVAFDALQYMKGRAVTNETSLL